MAVKRLNKSRLCD